MDSHEEIKEIDPLADLFQEGFDQIIFYEKQRGEEHKSRGQKNKERIQRLTRDMTDPQLKKQRNFNRRKAEKDKMNKFFQTMTKEEVAKFIEDKKNKKKEAKEKMKKALIEGQPIFIDLVFEEKMNLKENKSLAKQIDLIIKEIKNLEHPPAIHLCNFKGGIKEQMEKMAYQNLPMYAHSQNVVEVAKELNKKVIYLSPDAPLPLESVDSQNVYVLGGLIDRTIIKNASLNRSRDLGVEARHLPIRQFMKSRTCLNLDHVVLILSKFKQTGNWKESFDFGAPKRWKRGEKQEITEQDNKQEQQEYEEQEQVEIKSQEKEEKEEQPSPKMD